MTAQAKMAAETAATGPFVINLCSSTTPMALAQPKTEELKRFNFFVSRRRADGRDRFHLHMGHFMTLAEAEEWVNAVRDIYPGAWAGEAPGKKLAQRAAAGIAPQVPAAPPVLAAVEALAPEPNTVVASASAMPAPAPKLEAAPIVAAARQPEISKSLAVEKPEASRPAAIETPEAPPAVAHVAPPAVPTLHAVPEAATIPRQVPTVSAAPVARPVHVPAAATPVAPKKPKEIASAAKKPTTPGSNVREVLKALDDTAPTRMMPPPAVEPPPLSDTAVLKILEDRRADKKARGGEQAAKGIEMLRPDDTATVRALKDAVRDNEPVHFAVQLQWSVQPIDLAKVPPLAIFSAYTLYTVEGSRDGRKWYGLRLGFFGDAISAKQVASYVRSEFTSVAVLPVSTQERGSATGGDPKTAAASAARPRKEAERKADEFKLIDDVTDDIVSPGLSAAQSHLQAGGSNQPHKAAVPGAKRKALGRVSASEKRSVKSLEETLEILGASDLEIDNGRGEFLNDSGVRHLRVEQVKNSPFSKLLDRLTERVRKKA